MNYILIILLWLIRAMNLDAFKCFKWIQSEIAVDQLGCDWPINGAVNLIIEIPFKRLIKPTVSVWLDCSLLLALWKSLSQRFISKVIQPHQYWRSFAVNCSLSISVAIISITATVAWYIYNIGISQETDGGSLNLLYDVVANEGWSCVVIRLVVINDTTGINAA